MSDSALEQKFAQLRHNALPPRLVLWHHRDCKTGVAVIPKCGSNALNRAMESNDAWTQDHRPRQDVDYVAIIRDPMERWPSGFATFVANQFKHNRLSEDEANRLLDIPAIVEKVLGIVIFDVHTKPQAWFLPRLPVRLFLQENRGGFYRWLQERGTEIACYNVHQTATFEDGKPHKTVWQQACRLMQEPQRRDCIAKHYECDSLLYRYVSERDHDRGVRTRPDASGSD